MSASTDVIFRKLEKCDSAVLMHRAEHSNWDCSHTHPFEQMLLCRTQPAHLYITALLLYLFFAYFNVPL